MLDVRNLTGRPETLDVAGIFFVAALVLSIAGKWTRDFLRALRIEPSNGILIAAVLLVLDGFRSCSSRVFTSLFHRRHLAVLFSDT